MSIGEVLITIILTWTAERIFMINILHGRKHITALIRKQGERESEKNKDGEAKKILRGGLCVYEMIQSACQYIYFVMFAHTPGSLFHCLVWFCCESWIWMRFNLLVKVCCISLWRDRHFMWGISLKIIKDEVNLK